MISIPGFRRILVFAVTGLVLFGLSFSDSVRIEIQVLRTAWLLRELRKFTSDYYADHGRLPGEDWVVPISPETGLDLSKTFTLVAPGVARFDVALGDKNHYPVYLATTFNPTVASRPQFDCIYTDRVLQSALSRWLSSCHIFRGYEPPQPVATSLKAPVPIPPKTQKTGDAAASESISECLKPWSVDWKLPYHPQLSATCRTEVATNADGGYHIFAPGTRKTTIGFTPLENPLLSLAHPGDVELESIQAFFAHFDALFTQQGFRRTEVTRPNPDPGFLEPVLATATYERTGPPQPMQVRLRWAISGKRVRHGAKRPEMYLETMEGLNEKLRLPKPDAYHDLSDTGHYGPWLAFLGATLTQEGAGSSDVIPPDFQRNPATFITPYWDQISKDGNAFRQLSGKSLEYQFPPNSSQAEIFAAYRTALPSAGWSVEYEDTEYVPSLRASIILANHRLVLDLYLKTYSRNYGFPSILANATLVDPAVATRTKIILEALRRYDHYIFTPTFSAPGQATSDTEFQMNTLDAAIRSNFKQRTVRDLAQRGVIFSPYVDPEHESDDQALTKARTHTRWVAGAFKERGWPDQQLLVLEKPIKSREDFKESVPGAQISIFWCDSVTEVRPLDTVTSCECRTSDKVFQTTSGACP